MRNMTGRDSTFDSGAGPDGGFTLLEVMASVVIIGVAMTVLMTDRNDSIRRVNVTDSMRTATMLAQQKINEIILGMEAGTGGDFEGYNGFSWTLEEEQADVLEAENQNGGLEMITVVVTYPAGPHEAQLRLSAHPGGAE